MQVLLEYKAKFFSLAEKDPIEESNTNLESNNILE